MQRHREGLPLIARPDGARVGGDQAVPSQGREGGGDLAFAEVGEGRDLRAADQAGRPAVVAQAAHQHVELQGMEAADLPAGQTPQAGEDQRVAATGAKRVMDAPLCRSEIVEVVAHAAALALVADAHEALAAQHLPRGRDERTGQAGDGADLFVGGQHGPAGLRCVRARCRARQQRERQDELECRGRAPGMSRVAAIELEAAVEDPAVGEGDGGLRTGPQQGRSVLALAVPGEAGEARMRRRGDAIEAVHGRCRSRLHGPSGFRFDEHRNVLIGCYVALNMQKKSNFSGDAKRVHRSSRIRSGLLPRRPALGGGAGPGTALRRGQARGPPCSCRTSKARRPRIGRRAEENQAWLRAGQATAAPLPGTLPGRVVGVSTMGGTLTGGLSRSSSKAW